MVDRIRSTSDSSGGERLGMLSSANLLISASTSKCMGGAFSVAAEDVGAFIAVSGMWIRLCPPKPTISAVGLTTFLDLSLTSGRFRRLRGAPLLSKLAMLPIVGPLHLWER